VSEVVGEATVKLRTDTSQAESDASSAGKKSGGAYSSGFKGAIKGIGAAIAVTFAASKAVDFLKDSVTAARESAKVNNTTIATLRATKGASGETAKSIADLAGKMSMKTGVDDEVIQSGENVLLTFKAIRNEAGRGNDAFNRATQAAVDLSAAGFGSVQSASVMMGKALNDPIKGMTALQRVGVTLTEGQKKQVKSLQESGDILGAQKIILKAVEGQVGGVAAATATAGDKAKIVWGNIQEQIGGALLPVLDDLASFFVDTLAPALGPVLDSFSGFGDTLGNIDFGPILKRLQPLLETIKGFATDVGDAARIAGPALLSIWAGIQPLVGPALSLAVDALGKAFGLLGPAIVVVATALASTVSFIQQNSLLFEALALVIGALLLPMLVSMAVQVALTAALYVASWVFMAVQSMINAVKMAAAWLIALGPVGLVIAIIIGLIAVFVLLWKKSDAFRGFFVGLWGKITAAAKGAWDWIKKNWPMLLAVLLGPIAIATVLIIKNWDKIKKGFSAAWSFIKSTAGKIVGYITAPVQSAVTAVGRAWDHIKTLTSNLITSIAHFFSGLPAKIGSGLSSLAGVFTRAFDSLRRAGETAVTNVISKFSGLGSRIVSAIGGIAPHINWPDPPGWLKKVVPGMATGGIVTGPTLAVVGERGPELVIPAGQNARWAPGLEAAFTKVAEARGLGSGKGATIHVHMPTGDPQAAALAVMNRLATAGSG
jgi:hypothetical protein